MALMEVLEQNYLKLLEKQRILNEQLLNTENEDEMLQNLEEYGKVSEECDKISQQIDVLEHIEALKKSGAIVMQHKNILLHKNGAKLPVSKTYIEDGILRKDKSYTLILLPEE